MNNLTVRKRVMRPRQPIPQVAEPDVDADGLGQLSEAVAEQERVGADRPTQPMEQAGREERDGAHEARPPIEPAAEAEQAGADRPATVPFAAATEWSPPPQPEPGRPATTAHSSTAEADVPKEPTTSDLMQRIQEYRSRQTAAQVEAVERIARVNDLANKYLDQVVDASASAMAKTSDPEKQFEMLALTGSVLQPLAKQIVAGSAQEFQLRGEINQLRYAPISPSKRRI